MPPASRRQFIRYVGASAGAAAVSSSLAASALAEDEVAKLYDAAKKEGSINWYTSPYPQNLAEALRDAFNKKYPGVTCQLTRQTAQVVYQKVSNDLSAGVHVADVVSTSEFAHYTKWKQQNALAVYSPPDLKYCYKRFQNLDPDHAYHLACLSFVTIDYSPKVAAGHPRKWPDLLDPKWKGQVTLGHPAFSGFVNIWAITMTDKYGWDNYFKKLAENNPKIGRSIFDVVTDIIAGERTVGCGVDALAFQRKAQGNPIDVQWAEDEAVIIISPFGVMKDAPHPNAARLFANFYFSKEFSEACTAAYQYPLRGDAPAPNNLPLAKIKYHQVGLAEQEAKTQETIAKWRETFGV